MPFNPTYNSYLDIADNSSSSCPVYGLYIDKCGQAATNNFQVAVNGVYVGDFNGSKNPYYFIQDYPDCPLDEFGFPINPPCCPIVKSYGAPEYCNHYVNATFDPPMSSNCGGSTSKLFMFTSQTAFGSRVFPNNKSQPDGAGWPSTWTEQNIWRGFEDPLIISWHNNINLVGETFIPSSTRVSPSSANTVDLYPYFDYYDGAFCLDGSTLFPRTLNGNPACIGIIRYKKVNGYLYCDKFLPLKSRIRNIFTNRLTSTYYPLNQDSYDWWCEASIPVAHDPLPGWVPNKTYYW
jgi:hypothetical protein